VHSKPRTFGPVTNAAWTWAINPWPYDGIALHLSIWTLLLLLRASLRVRLLQVPPLGFATWALVRSMFSLYLLLLINIMTRVSGFVANRYVLVRGKEQRQVQVGIQRRSSSSQGATGH
jgi:hypothetical protein